MSAPTRPEAAACLEALRAKARSFPDAPGVYLMHDSAGKVLYIGKARRLRRRAGSYFRALNDTRALVPVLLAKVADITYLVTATESEALILEHNLIRKYRPHYNIRLKDDKAYLSLKVTVKDEWPRCMPVRHWSDDGAVYFGPFASAHVARELLRIVKRVFTLRTCSSEFFRSRTRPCLQHEIGRCAAPCTHLVTREDYRRQVSEVLQFLRGKTGPVLARLRREMAEAARELRYERAAVLRDRIQALEQSRERQAAQGLDLGDMDVFGVHAEDRRITVQPLFVRGGRALDAAPFHLRSALDLAEILRSFIMQFYLGGRDIPPEIVVPVMPEDRVALEAFLRERRGGRVRLTLGTRSQRRELKDLASQNAAEAAHGASIRENLRVEALAELGRLFGLSAPPRRIECFDISTTGGAQAVGSMAVMLDGEPATSEYRHFRVKSSAGMDDFAMLGEVLSRRLKCDDTLPELLVVDGGPAQVARAAETLAATGRGSLALAGIAKSRLKAGVRTEERVFAPGSDEPLPLPEDSPASRLLQALRDEAHRFAITYHRKLRSAHALTSGLENVPGLGKKRIRALFEHVGSFKDMRALTSAELAARAKIPPRVATALLEFLNARKER
jgi:excinuclease ABC subunit C